MNKFLQRYLRRNDNKENENIKKLEELTARIAAQSHPPEYPIMQVLIELSEHGVLGLDKEGRVVFNNLAATKFLNTLDLKGKLITEIVKGDGSNFLKEFIAEDGNSHTAKVDFDSSRDGQIFDVLTYRVKNGEICFIVFLINCLEKTILSKENCPIRENCPFNYKCKSTGDN